MIAVFRHLPEEKAAGEIFRKIFESIIKYGKICRIDNNYCINSLMIQDKYRWII